MFSEKGIINYVFSGINTKRIDYTEIKDFLIHDRDLLIPLNSKISWNLNSTPHALIAGGTGKGKTYLIYHMLYCLLLQNVELHIIDPKNTKLGTLKCVNDKINCYSNSDTINSDIFKLLRYLESEIVKRSDLLVDLNMKNPRT